MAKREKSCILIADDSEGTRDLLREELTAQGFDIIEAGDGEETLRVVMEQKPDLVILDLVMPRLSGLEVAMKMRDTQEIKDIPIIMLTGRWSVRDKMAGYQCGVNRYLTKPLDIGTLLDEVRMVLKHHEKI